MSKQTEHFGTLPDGRAVERVSITGGGLTACFLSYGAILQDLRMDGVAFPLVLGAPDLGPYLGDLAHSGAIAGRFANRIAHGRFSIDGQGYQTDLNSLGRHTLHGGTHGSGTSLWRIAEVGADRVIMALDMADGHMGFPGNLTVTVTCSLPGDGVLAFGIRAQTDAPTPCGFAQHSYFNLDGADTITAHELQVMADGYLPVDDDLIPLGNVAEVAGTRFDFTTARAVGHRGIDHNFCTGSGREALRRVAVLHSARSGISLSVDSTEPGLQVYDADHLGDVPGLDGRRYGPKSGLAMEAQIWPDAMNIPGAPEAVLRPGEVYEQGLRYGFRRG